MKAMHLVPALSLLVPAVALAQPEQTESTGFDRDVAAAKHAFEVSVGAGYAQGAGDTGGDMAALDELTGPGGAIEVGLGYRVIPNLTLGAYGTLSTFDNGDALDNDTNAIGASAGVQAAWHFRPDRSVDPWIRLGTGWKGLWLDPERGKTTSLQGLELAQFQVGVDYRITPEIAISPVVGGSLGMFVSQDTPMTDDYTEIADKQVNFTGFAGIAGTFDFGAKR